MYKLLLLDYESLLMILKMDITNKLQDKTSNESQGNSQS